MKNFSDNNEWFSARRKLASALKNSEELVLRNFKIFLENRSEFIPVLEDIIKFCSDYSLADVKFFNQDLLFIPEKISSGKFIFESGNFSSISEILLFVLPALSSCSSKSDLNIKGVTNSSISYPVSFIREILAQKISENGITVNLSSDAFGFYGRGGGNVLCDVSFSAVKKEKQGKKISSGSVRKLRGAKIILCGADSSLGIFQRDLIEKAFPELEMAGIIEVNSPGLGSWIYLNVEEDMQPLLFFREIPFYNYAGDLVFDYDDIEPLISDLRSEFQAFMDSGRLPWDIDSELKLFMP